jgi:hypothetical protein
MLKRKAAENNSKQKVKYSFFKKKIMFSIHKGICKTVDKKIGKQ